ncbi:hypothetical protein ACQ4PT_071850 [Festuca glaucescens]
MELGTEKEKKVLVWNMAKERGAARVRFMAVGVFLSVLAISSKTLLDGMKRIWQIRGHLDTLQLRDRRLPEIEKKKRFEDDMGVAPTHPKDPRRWFLPEKTGQSTQHHNLPWRAQEDRHRPGSTPPHRQLAIIAHVADEVGKLSMQEQPAIDSKGEKAANKISPASPTAATKHLQQHASNNLIIDFSGEEAATTTRPASPTTGESEHLHQEDSTTNIDNKSKGVATTTIPPAPSATTPKSLQHVGPTTTEAIDTNLQKRPLRWKRLRKEGADNTQGEKIAWTTQGGALEAPRT